jgi:hypothetical protein
MEVPITNYKLKIISQLQFSKPAKKFKLNLIFTLTQTNAIKIKLTVPRNIA